MKEREPERRGKEEKKVRFVGVLYSAIVSGGSEKQVCAYGMCDGDHFLWRPSIFSWLRHVPTITIARVRFCGFEVFFTNYC